MTNTVSRRIDATLADEAFAPAKAEFRTVQEQADFEAKVNRTVLDNPDLPASFVAESLMALAEPRDEAQPFVPRNGTSAAKA